MMQSTMEFDGKLKAKVTRAPKAPLSWRVRNMARWSYIFGRASNKVGEAFSAITGLPVLTSELKVRVFKADGQVIDYGLVDYRLVTTAFVNFMVDELQAETTEWGDFKYHDSGIGVTGANIADTDIETTDGEGRATGNQGEGASANIYQSVGTISYTTTKAITEHGLFSQSTGATLMDRHTFAAINVENGDSIQFTYELTVSAGG